MIHPPLAADRRLWVSMPLSARTGATLLLWWAVCCATLAQSTATNVVGGLIGVPGQKDTYVFNVATNSRFYFDALTNVSALQWSLSGPPIAPIVNRSFTGSDAQNISDPTIALPAGDYTLTIQSAGGTTNGYVFRFVNLADATLLSPGTVVSNTLAPATKTDFYQFTAAAGDRYYFHQVLRSGLPNTWWRLMDSYGNQVFSQSFYDVGTPSAPVTLPAAGTYTLMIEGYIGDSGSGAYAFNVVPEGNVPPAPFTGVPMNLGDLIVSNLVANTTNTYIFTLAKAARAVFDPQTNSQNLTWTLDGPSGRVVNQRGLNSSGGIYNFGPLDLPAGDYQLRVQGTTSSPYRFQLLDLSSATPLTPGTAVTNQLSPASAAALYRFDAAAGTRFFFDSLAVNNLPNAYWRLVDPYGAVLFMSPAGANQGPLSLNNKGVYTLMIEGYWGDNGSGSNSFRVVPITDGLQALTLGSLVSGAIGSPGQRQQYTFTLAGAARLYFDSLTNNSNLRWSLDGPQGNAVNGRSFNGSDAQTIGNPVLPLSAGSYTLTVWAYGDTVSGYQFRLFDLATAIALTPGTSVSGALNPANATVAYQFTLGSPGRYFYDYQSSSGLPNTYVRLIDAYGNMPITTYLGGDVGPLDLAAGGYTLLVEGYIGDTGNGSYTFNLTPVNDGSQALTLGSLVSGAIGSPGQRQQYTFTLAGAARLYFDSLTNNSNLRWSLDGPQGNAVNGRSFNGSDAQTIGNPVLPLSAGSYTLTVWAYGDTVSGYQFRLFDLATAIALTPGTSVSGALNPANATVAYQFTLGSPGRYFYDYQSSSGLPNTYVRLIDAYGNMPITTYLGGDVGPLDLAAGGYTLLVEGYIGDTGNGSYTFNLTPVNDGSQALTLGSLVSGAIGSPGQRQQYTFTLAGAARLYFDSLTNNSNLRWSLDGPQGNAVNGRSFNGSDAQTIGNPVLPLSAGSYTLTVWAYGDTVSGYQFRLFDLATATALTPGTVVSGALNPANATVAYQFTLGSPGRYFYDYQSSSGLPNTYVRLIDAYGNMPITTYLGGDVGPLDLAAGGYTLLVEGYIGDTGNGSYTFNLTPVNDGSQALTLGSLVSGAIGSPGQRQQYTFTLAGAARLYFDSLTNNSNLRWSLDGPQGNAVNGRSFNGSDAQTIGNPVLPLSAGSYTLTVWAYGDTVSGYQFRLFDLATAAALTPGTLANVNNFPANSTDLYRFDAAAGDRFVFSYQASSGIPNAYWRVIDPYNNIIFAQYFANSTITNVLAAAGTYTLLLEGYIGDTGLGAYGFTVLSLGNVPPTPFTGTPLTLGSAITNNLATNNATTAYTFTLPNTARLSFDALANASFYWSLQGPAGMVVNNRSFLNSDGADANDSSLILPGGGYQLTITGAAGGFAFRLLDFANAALITPGTVVTNALTPANSTVLYRFTGAAGQQLYFDGRASSGFAYQPYCRLYGPLGNLILSTYINNDVDTFALPQSGAYTLSVEGRIYDNNASGNYAFNLLPVTYATNALAIGATTSGTLAMLGQRQFYPFTLAQAATLYFDALTNADFVWRLDAPWGPVVTWRAFNGSDGPDISDPALSLPAGAYTLTVAGGSNYRTTGDYRFRLLNFTNTTALTLGTVVTNALTPANSTVLYRFTGAAGQQLYFDGRASSGFTYQPYCRLYGPMGNLILSTYINNDVDTFALPQSGAYTLSVEGRIYDNNASGNYAFNLLPVTYATNALAIGATTSGTLAMLGQRQFYPFTLAQAATLYFDALTNADFVWRLDAPWGPVVNWRAFNGSDGPDISDPTLSLPAGAYTLTVAGGSNYRTTGDYRFRLLNFTNTTALTLGTVVTNALSPANSTVLYRFTGAAGQQLYFDGRASSGFAYQPYCRLYGPMGNLILSTYINNDVDTFALPQSGAYTLSVEGRIYDNNASGNYAFNLLPVTYATNALAIGATTSGTLAMLGQRQFYPFTLAQAATLYFDALTNADFVWRLDAPWGPVVNWRAFNGSDGPDISDPALSLPAGAYTLTVAGGSNYRTTGDYRFRLLNFTNTTAFTPGTVVTNALTPANSTLLYQFSAAAGNRYYFDGQLADGFSYTPYCRIYAPYGNILLSQYVNNDVDTFTLPQSGTYTLTVEGRIYDTHTTGNYAFNLVPNPQQPALPLFPTNVQPDLIVAAVSVSPSSGVQSGGAATVLWTDQNTGSGATSGSFTDRVTIRNAASQILVDAFQPYVESDPGNGPLAPGGTRNRQLAVRLPDGPGSVGALQVTIAVDAQNNIAESNEANNSSSANITVKLAPYPDLLVDRISVTPPTGWLPGSLVTINWRITNSGAAFAATNWMDSVVVRNTNTAAVILSATTNYNLGDPGNGPVAPGDFRNRSLSFTMPSDANAYGFFAITVTADSANQVFEYNADGTAELNNSAAFNVLSAPDLVPTGLAVSPSGSVQSGGAITISWNDLNTGAVDTGGPFYDRVTVVNTNTAEILLNATPYYNPNVSGNGPIPPGGSRARSTTLTLPDGARGAGMLQISVALDTFNQIPEFNASGVGEANNTATITAASTIAPYPDLQVAKLTVQPAALVSGTNVIIQWQDTNSGNAIVTGSWYDHVTVVNTNLGLTLLDTTVYHNSSTLGPLTNGMAHDRSVNFTLPNGTNGSGALLITVMVDSYNNIFEYNAAGTGEDNNTATALRSSSLAPLPDLVITRISSTNTTFTSQIISAQFRLANQGLIGANADMVQRVFLSSSPVAGTGTLAAQADYNGSLPAGQFIDQTVSVLMPSVPGNYWLIAQADANNSVAELEEGNNFLVSSTPVNVVAAYNATIAADLHAALANTPIPMHGQATLGINGAPAAYVPLTIHVLVRGTDRSFSTFTAADGRFTNVFHPLPNEAGVYQLAAALPGVVNPPVQDTFVLIGMNVAPVPLVDLNEGVSVTNWTRVDNLSDIPLTSLTATVLTNQPNLAVSARLDTNSLSAFASTSLAITVRAIDASVFQSPVVIRVASAEGAVSDLTFLVRVEALRPKLVASPASLQGSMQRGAQKSAAFTVANQGGVPTGPLQVVFPSLPWLSLASPSQLPPLAPGSNTTVTILLTPAADLPLGDYNGTLVIQSTNAAVSVPYSFRAISSGKGNLLLTAEDEYTYFAAGSPRVTNALVVLSDALTGVPVVTNRTGADGTLLLTNLTEAFYIVDVSATNHSPFRQSALVPAGGATNVVAFLVRQTVTYSFTVTPTTVADQYTFTVDSTFETQVPVPVVTIEPASLDLAQYPANEFQVLYTISNHGLIDAAHVNLNFPGMPHMQITALVTNLGKLAANSSLTVPVMFKRLANAAASGPGSCSVTAQMLWDYLCGPNVVDKSTAYYIFDSTGCDLRTLYFQVYDLVPDNPSPGPGSLITTQDFVDYLNQFQVVTDFEAPPGYHFQCKTAPAAALSAAVKSPRLQFKSASSGSNTSVCAKVQIRLDQKGVLTRDAFKATLEINNDLTNALSQVQASLQITDLNSGLVSTNFAITGPDLSGLTAVDGTGILPGSTTGLANWTIIPTLDAAPASGMKVYLVGGTLSYTQDGTQVSVPLAAAPIQVFPQPELVVRYFHDRNVFADDPFTPQIEPSLPYSLAVQVNNVGHGPAQALTISSAQPKIVDNVKGLLINFAISGAQLEQQPVTPSLSVDFGRIDPGTNKIARWLFTSSVQGSFTNFSASFSQVDQFGKPRLSLVRNVEIHELNHIVDAGGAFEDARPDFLVNDMSDPDFLPDTLYLSDGSTNSVAAVTNVALSGVLGGTNVAITVTSPPSSGWTYFRFGNPGSSLYQLAHVLRADHSEIPFGTNVWTTDRAFLGGDKVPILTNQVHLLDYNSQGSYTLVYAPVATNVEDTLAPVSAVAALPTNSPPIFTVQWSGSDNPGGGGLAFFDVYISTNSGPFGPWLANTTLAAALFTGVPNTTYAFSSQATDAAGNREAAHAIADARTTITLAGNAPPIITAIPTQTVTEGDLFVLTPKATDADLSAETLSWTLLPGAPPAALIAPDSGRITWQTSLGDGGTTNLFKLVVSDNGSPSLSATQTFNVIVTHQANRPPVLTPIINQAASVLIPLVITNTATDPDFPANKLTFSLDPGAPAGAFIDPASGLFAWVPTRTQAPSTNTITVRVTDNGLPPLSDSSTFTVIVSNFLEVVMGSAILHVGDTGAVAILIDVTTPVTNLSLTLDIPAPGLTNFSLASPVPPLASATVLQTGLFEYQLNLGTLPGQTLFGPQTVSTLHFEGVAQAPSAFVPLRIAAVSANQPNGVALARTLRNDGRVVFINGASLLEASLNAGLFQLVLYAPPGPSYTVLGTPRLSPPINWSPVWNGAINNLYQVITMPATNASAFFRAVAP